jgi:DNA-binding response OmpR family regulator
VIAGLEFGAADYVTKPFSMPILRARVKAVLRRSKIVEPTVGGPTYDDGYLSVDLDRREVAVRGNSKRLSVKEFELLSCLLENAGRVLTFPQILSTVWGDQHWDSDDYVHVYIWQLRQKLERNPKKPAYILTERGRGYRFAKTAA